MHNCNGMHLLSSCFDQEGLKNTNHLTQYIICGTITWFIKDVAGYAIPGGAGPGNKDVALLDLIGN